MRDSFRLHTTHMKYWASMITVTVLLGASLGYVGNLRAQQMQKLTLTTVETDTRFIGIEHKITDLDTRLTTIERTNVPPAPKTK